jgi:hypothetical protein
MEKKRQVVAVIGGSFAGRRVERLLSFQGFEVKLIDAKV